MAQQPTANRRRYFRLKYPPILRPTFIVWQDHFEVIEISEGGIVFLADRLGRFPLNEYMAGAIKFHDGHAMLLEGTVLRKSMNSVVLQLTKYIPLARVHTEERMVIQNTTRRDH